MGDIWVFVFGLLYGCHFAWHFNRFEKGYSIIEKGVVNIV